MQDKLLSVCNKFIYIHIYQTLDYPYGNELNFRLQRSRRDINSDIDKIKRDHTNEIEELKKSNDQLGFGKKEAEERNVYQYLYDDEQIGRYKN